MQTICFTGTCNDYTRAELTKMVEGKYEVKDSVTKDLDILVCADPNAGSSKLQKAAKNGVNVMSYADFLKMFENAGEKEERDEKVIEMGPVVKIRIRGTTTHKEVELSEVWFANDKGLYACKHFCPEDISVNCVKIHGFGSESWMVQEENGIFECELDDICFETCDKDGKRVFSDEWSANDFVALVKGKKLRLKNAYADVCNKEVRITITSMSFEDENGVEYVLPEEWLKSEPIQVYEEVPLYALANQVEDLNGEIDEEKVKAVEKAYGIDAPGTLKRFITMCNNDKQNYINNDGRMPCLRILTFKEVLNPKSSMDFKDLGCVPVADCFNCDFIAYDYKNGNWIWIEDEDCIQAEAESLRTVLSVLDGCC